MLYVDGYVCKEALSLYIVLHVTAILSVVAISMVSWNHSKEADSMQCV